jgi:hypothetical protein
MEEQEFKQNVFMVFSTSSDLRISSISTSISIEEKACGE